MAKVQVFSNIAQLMTSKGVAKKRGRHIEAKDLSILKNAAMVVEEGQVAWVGKQSQLPEKWRNKKPFDCFGKCVFPGFIDCHTHMIFAGDRKAEFEMRNQGLSYQEVADQGGGILSTVKATRRASLQELTELGQKRLNYHLSQGVTSVEIKSGYGLTAKSELKMLLAAQSLKGAKVHGTFLGAHAIPKEYSDEDTYLSELLRELRKVQKEGLSQRVDIFIEKNYFSLNKAKDYLLKAKGMGFDITIHADQLSRTGATALAVELEAKSADHSICLNSQDIKKLAASETVAVLLPAADFYLQCAYPKARKLIDQGACVALATDFNPGSSPTQNISFVGVLARLQMKMTLPEVFAALTYGGAKALGVEQYRGALLPGYEADFFISDQSWQDFFYDLNGAKVWKTFVNGKSVYW